MDPLPLIPENFNHHEVAPTLRAALQPILDGRIYPKDIAENFLQNIKEDDEINLKKNATSVLQIYKHADEENNQNQMVTIDIMLKQAKYMIEKQKIDNSYSLREGIKLKHCDIFKQLEVEFINKYNLINSSDLLPDLVYRYLVFRKDKHHVCPACKEKITMDVSKQTENKIQASFLQPQPITFIKKSVETFQVFPNTVVFHNYKVNHVYKKTVKIINTSPTLQAISLEKFPKSPYLTIMFNNDKRLAPGMNLTATITFKPKIYKTERDTIRFRNNLGETVEIQVLGSRDVPKLLTCILKSTMNITNFNETNYKLDEKRSKALNSTIDCGSCFVSQYTMISIVLENRGIHGKFFFITEDDWFFQNIEDVSACMELFKGDFWIYPTFFEIDNSEIMEVNTIFQPTKPGLHIETLYLMCDNNSYQQIELVGDAIEFSKNLIDVNVPPKATESATNENYTVFFGHIDNNTTKTLAINVKNNSPVWLTHEWKFRSNDLDDVDDILESWIMQNNFNTKMIPYNTTQFEFNISFQAENSGYHSTFFCFYITNIPMASLKENERFFVIEKDEIYGKTLSNAVDVLIIEIEVCAFVEIKKENPPKCICNEPIKQKSHQRLAFSCPFINFGILPSGLDVKKEFYVRNDAGKTLNWSILEIKYNVDISPYMEVIKDSSNLNCCHGTCSGYRHNRLCYKVINKAPLRYVSVLVLLSEENDSTVTIEDICVVTYQVIHFDIEIKGKDTNFPILCPLEIVYRGIPKEIQFTIENHSPITGYIQFLNPIGEDTDKIAVHLLPSSTVIKPREIITAKAMLVCSETGIFEHFYIPVFVGAGQEPIIIKVLCVVDGPRLTFYLPMHNDYFKKIVWPPKINYNYNVDFCPCEMKDCYQTEDEISTITECCSDDDINSPLDLPIPKHIVKLNFSSNWSSTNLTKITDECGISIKSSELKLESDIDVNVESGEKEKFVFSNRLEKMLREELDGNTFLHADIIEVYKVPVFTPTRVSIYVENTTPIAIKYNAEPKNFVDNKNFDQVAVRLRLKKNEEIWNDLMGTEYGIMVQPEIDQEEIEGSSAIRLDFWIYANTYGIYSEEIVIEMSEIPTFHFSMLIEVVGSPIQIPMALNCLTETPTIRFGAVSFDSADITRRINITNVSSIPINIVWQPFMKKPNTLDIDLDKAFNVIFTLYNEKVVDEVGRAEILDKYFGEVNATFCDVVPRDTRINPKSTAFLDIVVKPQKYEYRTKNVDILNCVIGIIYLEQKYVKKPNFYYRSTGPNLNRIELNVATRLERQSICIDTLDEKCLSLKMHANDILLKKQEEYSEYIVLKNKSSISYEVEITIDYPFYFKISKHKTTETKNLYFKAWSCEEVRIFCHFSISDVLKLSNLVYYDETAYYYYEPDEKLIGTDYTYDTDTKFIHFTKYLNIKSIPDMKQFPIEVDLYYPCISVKPRTVNFSTVLCNQTQKGVVTIFNHTGSAVKFEICKSSDANCFFITPHYGEVPASTGKLKQFFNIFIYFCATECKKYYEAIRIVTNIPNYFIEVPLKGVGSLNEKFAINYKK